MKKVSEGAGGFKGCRRTPRSAGKSSMVLGEEDDSSDEVAELN